MSSVAPKFISVEYPLKGLSGGGSSRTSSLGCGLSHHDSSGGLMWSKQGRCELILVVGSLCVAEGSNFYMREP